MARKYWRWATLAVHMANKKEYDNGIRKPICWVTGRRGLSLTLNPERVTCKFCKKILEAKNAEAKNVDEYRTT